MLFRDADKGENLWWEFCDREGVLGYAKGRRFLEGQGYTILSVTTDGFRGLVDVFNGIPFQACHFHMKQTCIRHLTLKPQTDAGKVLLLLARSLTRTNSHHFRTRLAAFHSKYGSFLNERTTHPDGTWSWTHDGVRSAFVSLANTLPYLFTYEHDKTIPHTTNTCEGHFSHLKDVVRIHRGLTKERRHKMIAQIFLESTIAPKTRK